MDEPLSETHAEAPTTVKDISLDFPSLVQNLVGAFLAEKSSSAELCDILARNTLPAAEDASSDTLSEVYREEFHRELKRIEEKLTQICIADGRELTLNEILTELGYAAPAKTEDSQNAVQEDASKVEAQLLLNKETWERHLTQNEQDVLLLRKVTLEKMSSAHLNDPTTNASEVATAVELEPCKEIIAMTDGSQEEETVEMEIDDADKDPLEETTCDTMETTKLLQEMPPLIESDIKKKDSGVDLIEETTNEAKNQKVIPRFYFPSSSKHPHHTRLQRQRLDILQHVRPLFFPDNQAESHETETVSGLTCNDFVSVTCACQLPRFWNLCFFTLCADPSTQRNENADDMESDEEPRVTYEQFSNTWKQLIEKWKDDVDLCFGILWELKLSQLDKEQKDEMGSQVYLVEKDFELIMKDLIMNHPGLKFLESAPVFQGRYSETVIARLFYGKPNAYNLKMTLREFRKTEFVKYVRNLEVVRDINGTRDIFSYKHFYVIYCKFWELDQDHDMFIDRFDLANYDHGSLSSVVFDRVISGHGKSRKEKPNHISYNDFIWFILSAEDKMTPSAQEYWFRIMDLDGDGLISLHELSTFYKEQYSKMCESMPRGERFEWNDWVCIVLDIIRPANGSSITLGDLKKSPLAGLFFDMVFDYGRWLRWLQRHDMSARDPECLITTPEGERIRLTGWDRYAEVTYDLVAEKDPDDRDRYDDVDYDDFMEEDFDEDEVDEEDDEEDDDDRRDDGRLAAILEEDEEGEDPEGQIHRVQNIQHWTRRRSSWNDRGFGDIASSTSSS